MKYNTQREKLTIPEYGRNVQSLVDYALTIEDREKNGFCGDNHKRHGSGQSFRQGIERLQA